MQLFHLTLLLSLASVTAFTHSAINVYSSSLSRSAAQPLHPSASALPDTGRGSAAGNRGLSLGLRMQQTKPDESWNVGRFVETLTFFNGNPLLKLIPFVPSATPSVARPGLKDVSASESVLWDFSGLAPAEFSGVWASLDDVVMGGVSKSSIKQADHGATMFGETSSRNNGGFCSARTRNVDPAFDVQQYSGVAVRVKCDKGMRYKLCLRDRPGWDTISWCYSFDTKPGQWMDLKVPFSEFTPVVRGNTLPPSAPSARAIDTSSLFSVQMMLSKYEYNGALNPNFQEGEFELQFGPIRAIK